MVSSGCCFSDSTKTGSLSDKQKVRIPSLFKLQEEAEAASAAFGDRWEHGREESARRARSRARNRVFDLINCNQWNYFITLTLSPDKVNRYDYTDIVRHLNIWLDNRVRRKGLRYIIVPEHHKDGAIHFHGLINDVLYVVDSGKKDKQGHIIYNLPEWDYGFTTAIELYGSTTTVSKYVLKYVTKENHKVGGRWYLHGGQLAEPTYTYDWVDYDTFSADGSFEYVPEEGYSFKILNLI